ncbi:MULTISPECIES: MCE family protein [unclassified Rhodococcus (in: high G+C Gram-positive bacteria)]|uniref:MCE family protein n=1 Tax=unclassified Rhodococcus (in: high G+C Gram-positive bacteria) TaxID=192944 RepID=UPI000E09FB74|nr:MULTISPECIES: MCE family protein [unclassified Rhodococcus (in: high G+C Gram-positive bacteria)]QKT10089.1 MCE family protein [Rhodococcus sp. W8901]RDI30208.1 phospholipid/cholesterol/gamma-HCH transport system substrate-binding protein [Rhodococcus sp. AG1013]
MPEARWKTKLAAAVMVLGLVAIVVVALTMFVGGFTKSEPVTVTASRSGLVMEPDAKVKLRGVEVGRVASIDEVDGQARIKLDMDPSQLHLIPANSPVEIKSTTVFGAKYVNFVTPSDPSPKSLQPGSVIGAESVTVEFNTLFQNLSTLLQQIEPEKLNATLGAISSALNGRGNELGELLGETDAYLKKMNPTLPQLKQDLNAAATVTNTYADVTPDLMTLLGNLTATSGSIVEERENLRMTLENAVALANNGNQLLTDNEANLTRALDLLEPTTALLSGYSPAISCLIVGLNKARPMAEQIEGGGQAGFAMSSSFLAGLEPYTYPRDLPKVNATGGPSCWGLPDFDPKRDGNAPFVVTDNANTPYMPSTKSTISMPTLFQMLYGGTPVAEGRN